MDYSVKESAMRGPGLTLLWSVFCLCSLFLVVPVAGHCDSGLFISEYVEGTGLFNRALELYNAAPREINTVVDEIRIEFYSDGMTQPRSTLIEGAGSGVVIPPGECHVIVHWSADAELLAYADETAIVLGDFDGNDAIVVKLNGVVVDVFGQVGFDPGAGGWGSGEVTTVDHTLRRTATVCSGDVNGQDEFDPLVEWQGFALGTYENLGVHTPDCGSVANRLTGWSVLKDAYGQF